MPPEILLIDDDAAASAIRKRVLEIEGYRVQMALDADSGVDLARVLHPALVLLDHIIGERGGPAVLKEIWAVCPDTPVISLSGHSGLHHEYDPPPDAFVTKGDGVHAFLATVARLLPG